MGGRHGVLGSCLVVAVLFAILATGDIGGAEASGFGRRSTYFLSASMATAGPRNLALLALWPTSTLAASHLRVDPGTGLIEELPESEIAEDAVFHTPVQHPGGQRPGSQEENNKILYPGQWHSWTSLGPDRDGDVLAGVGGGAGASTRRGGQLPDDPSAADNDTRGGVNINNNNNKNNKNGLNYGGIGSMADGASQATYSAPSPSPSSPSSSVGVGGGGGGGGGAVMSSDQHGPYTVTHHTSMDNLPLAGISKAPTVVMGSATTHASAPGGGKRYHPEPALAVLFDRYGGVDTALEVLTRTTAQNGNDPVMWSDLGNAYRVKGDSDRAIECFESALRLQPHPDFFLNLGGVRFVLGEVDEAVRLFTLGLQINPRHVLLQFSMGNAYAMLGRKEEAARSFESTLRIQPDFTAAEQYLRTLRREMKQQWWPNWWIVAACALFVVVCAAVQRVVQYYAMGGAEGASNGASFDDGDGGNNDGGGYATSGVGGVLGMFGVLSGSSSRLPNNAAGTGTGHVSGGGVKQRRKGRHH